MKISFALAERRFLTSELDVMEGSYGWRLDVNAGAADFFLFNIFTLRSPVGFLICISSVTQESDELK
jgi:hypothetical protein